MQIQNAGFNIHQLPLSQILWNFYEAKTVTVTSVGVPGSILAPLATVTLSNGEMRGTIVANSINANGEELYEAPFKGNWLVP